MSFKGPDLTTPYYAMIVFKSEKICNIFQYIKLNFIIAKTRHAIDI